MRKRSHTISGVYSPTNQTDILIRAIFIIKNIVSGSTSAQGQKNPLRAAAALDHAASKRNSSSALKNPLQKRKKKEAVN